MSSSSPDGDGNQRARNIVQGMGSLTAQNLGSSLLGFLFLAGLLHLLPEVQYGVYSAVLVSMTIAGAFAGFGLNLAATRFVAYLREEDEKTSWVAARKILQLSILFSVVVTAFYLAASPLLSVYFAKTSSWTWAFLLGGGWLFASTLANTVQGILQGLKKYVLLAKILIVTRVTMVVFTLGFLLYSRNVGFAIDAWVLYYSLIICWILVLIGRDLFGSAGSFRFLSILKYSSPLGVAGIISAFSTSSDIVVVGGYLSAGSLGVYNAAITISGVLAVVALSPLTTALLPEISSSRSEAEISHGVRLTLRFVTIAILPASLFVAGVAPQFLDLFSSGGVYLAGSLTLELIALFYVFLAVQTILIVVLQAVGKTIEVIVVGAIAAATDIGVAVLLVPQFGLAGAVTSKVAVSLDGMFVAIYFTRKYLKNLDRVSFYLKGIFAAGMPFFVVLLLSYYLSSRVITLVPYAVTYSILFLVCTKVLRLLSDEDRAFLAHVLPGGLKRFVAYV